MATGAPTGSWDRPSRRRLPRFRLQAPLDVTVLRSGIPDTVPGRSVNVCERGIAVVLAGELLAGETVGVEMRLSPALPPLRTRATVRYHDKLRCGLEFVAMPPEQLAAIRDWVKELKAEPEPAPAPKPEVAASLSQPIETLRADGEAKEEKDDSSFSGGASSGGPRSGGASPRRRRRRSRRAGAILISVLVFLIAAAGIFWWKWNRDWEELEAGLKSSDSVTTETPHVQVSAEVMQKLIVHRVEPVYPPEARKDRLEGVIALDVVVGRDGSVVSMKALNGPDVLAHAAMDALRWWKFEPYRINGEPVVVETTVAVEFKR
jgi:TonB family protein